MCESHSCPCMDAETRHSLWWLYM